MGKSKIKLYFLRITEYVLLRKRRKVVKVVFLCFFCMALLSSVGCTSSITNGDKPCVIVILKTMSSEYWKYVEAGVNQACKDFGISGKVMGPASEGHILDQVHLIEDVLSQNPDALIIAPILPSTTISVLNRTKETNVPIFFLDTDVAWPQKIAYVGTDNYEAGRQGGKALVGMLQKGDRVALIGGALGNPTTDERLKGAKQALLEGGLAIVSEQPADSDKAKAMSIMENILQIHPDIKGVYTANDEMALGAYRAVEGIRPHIKVIGTDGTIEAIQSVKEGKLAGTVAQNPYIMGYKSVESALRKIKGNKVDEWINSGVEVILKGNAPVKLAFLNKIKKER